MKSIKSIVLVVLFSLINIQIASASAWTTDGGRISITDSPDKNFEKYKIYVDSSASDLAKWLVLEEKIYYKHKFSAYCQLAEEKVTNSECTSGLMRILNEDISGLDFEGVRGLIVSDSYEIDQRYVSHNDSFIDYWGYVWVPYNYSVETLRELLSKRRESLAVIDGLKAKVNARYNYENIIICYHSTSYEKCVAGIKKLMSFSIEDMKHLNEGGFLKAFVIGDVFKSRKVQFVTYGTYSENALYIPESASQESVIGEISYKALMTGPIWTKYVDKPINW